MPAPRVLVLQPSPVHPHVRVPIHPLTTPTFMEKVQLLHQRLRQARTGELITRGDEDTDTQRNDLVRTQEEDSIRKPRSSARLKAYPGQGEPQAPCKSRAKLTGCTTARAAAAAGPACSHLWPPWTDGPGDPHLKTKLKPGGGAARCTDFKEQFQSRPLGLPGSPSSRSSSGVGLWSPGVGAFLPSRGTHVGGQVGVRESGKHCGTPSQLSPGSTNGKRQRVLSPPGTIQETLSAPPGDETPPLRICVPGPGAVQRKHSSATFKEAKKKKKKSSGNSSW
ncbi:uncharacterized protein LOC117981612 [Pan paniscus]|uniref:uncharacterized protein LOC117981612 n=1 Tax=Pan paniscus TaxID=9597 RepID=UPI00243694A6|nr:uncharacterized protein LOC117981612 [Pan paniscus]